MFDPNEISEEEMKVLQEIAASKGITLEETLYQLGHQTKEDVEETITIDANTEAEPPVQLEQIDIQKEDKQQETDSLYVPIYEEEQAPPPPPAAEIEPETSDESEEDDDLGSVRQVCVQCGWDQEVPTIPEPEPHEKLAFLHAVLGQKTFSKNYDLFGNNLKVTFRALTVREIDTLYQETFKASKTGVITTAMDYYEYLNRLRLYLQLTFISAKGSTLYIKLPDGLSQATNDSAKQYWDTFLQSQKEWDEQQSLVDQIQNYITANVLKTEHLQRTITHECNKFNKLVAKLEASVDSPDFWKETGLPS